MIVVYWFPHGDGVEAGMITGSGFDSSATLVGLDECDAEIVSFDTEKQAWAWLTEHGVTDVKNGHHVTGGWRFTEEEE